MSTFKFTLYDKNSGQETEHQVPGKTIVCTTCEGKGSRVNPAIDGHGLTREDFDADPDFHEAYFRGDYDVKCSVCDGERVLIVVDYKRLPKKGTPARQAWDEHCRHEEEYARDWESERFLRMAESGERW